MKKFLASFLGMMLLPGLHRFGILDVQTIAANPGFPITLGNHRYSASSDGQLLHYIDEQLRATVPPDGWDDFVKYWPTSIDVVRQLRAQASVKAAAAAAARQVKVQAALATLPAGTDPAIKAAVSAAIAAALDLDVTAAPAPAKPDPLNDPDVKAALAILAAKGIDARAV